MYGEFVVGWLITLVCVIVAWVVLFLVKRRQG